jgi:sugar/nucleoside kinase (ribokinase family)
MGLSVSTMDTVALVDHFPAGEEVQRAIEMTVQGGGPVTTAVVTLARLGASVAMVDALGTAAKPATVVENCLTLAPGVQIRGILTQIDLGVSISTLL